MEKELKITYEMDERLLAQAEKLMPEAEKNLSILKSGEMEYTGWVNWASRFSEPEIAETLALAKEIREKCEAMVICGIGGSYLGAKAALDFIGAGGGPEILFAGFNLSGTYHQQLRRQLADKDFCLLNISKSGGTVEPSMAFEFFRRILNDKYGNDEANRRTYAITDKSGGKLRAEADEKRWKSLIIPSDVGGRYSVLTPVGLLPMAVAGIDIHEVIHGAIIAEGDPLVNKALYHACIRRCLQLSGKTAEVYEFLEPRLESLSQWCLQLFGESEGKGGMGMLPVSVGLSRDLHSLGQFLQDGNQIFTETIIDVTVTPEDVIAKSAASDVASSMNSVNNAVKVGTIRAHRSVDIPISVIDVLDLSPFSFGELVYFLELTCGVTGLLMGVNPFDQPGVEAYKREMMAELARK